MSAFLARLRERAAAEPRTIAVTGAPDPRVVEAARVLARDGLARPVLVGPAREIEAAARVADYAPEILDAPSGAESVAAAARGVAEGRVDGCVAGAVESTATVLRAYLRDIGTGPERRTLSSAFYVIVPVEGGSERVLTFADAGVLPTPGERELVQIAGEAARARRAIVGDEPRVAFLSYSTHGSADGESVRAMRRAAAAFAAANPDIPVDGELQADAALVPGIAARKAPGSPLAGDANVLIFPDLNAANIGYKLVQWLAGGVALGPILQGLAAPANDLSRGASADDIVHVACITGLLA